MNDNETFGAFFEAVASDTPLSPHPYQTRLAMAADWPETLVIPTGFGKTAAVVGAWLWRLSRDPAGTPFRLVICQPMRTLVEQTRRVVVDMVTAASGLPSWNADLRPLVDVLMGGEDQPRGAPDWVMAMDRPAILIGTQDLLVSAALMRGYGATRYRWPVDFALLHTDALWVFDEVQLAGATLPTSAQLQAWRRDPALFPAPDDGSERLPRARPARTLWMSATLDPSWLKTVDHDPTDRSRANDLQADDYASAHAAKLWGAVKRLSKSPDPPALKTAKEIAAYAAWVADLTRTHIRPDGTVLVFVNTVARAQAIYRALAKAGVGDAILLHSRFRPPERQVATDRALANDLHRPSVIVTTQALEAGVDITSTTLITEIAPWSSMVQRFGRCNRYGECGEAGAVAMWIDLPAGAEAPYLAQDLNAARAKLAGLDDCGPETLSRIAPSPPAASPVIRKRDLTDLFDTEADLSGFDVDISMYVRETDDVDVRLFWREVPDKGVPQGVNAVAPTRDELCPAPIAGARALLKRKGVRAWRQDSLGRGKKAWITQTERELRPGTEVMIAADGGGYNSIFGFSPEASVRVEPLPRPDADKAEAAVGLDDDLDTAVGARVTLAQHSRHVRDEAETLCKDLGINGVLRDTLVEAALWHDRGKAHPAFQQMLDATWRPGGELLAKSKRRPKPAGDEDARAEAKPVKPDPDLRRPRFRHELASALAWLEAKGWSQDADLGAYLIAAHHGKVRMRLRALPEEKVPDGDRLFARGVWHGDPLPASALADEIAPAATMDLDLMLLGEGAHGPSWSARTQALLRAHGPFRLAWLEALIRIADWRASAAEAYAADHGLDPDAPWAPDMSKADR